VIPCVTQQLADTATGDSDTYGRWCGFRVKWYDEL